MKNKLIIIVISLFISGFTIKKMESDSYKYHAFFVAEERLLDIKIDGDIEDWAWIPENYKVPANQLIFQKNSTFNSEDLDGYFYVGWNGISNKLYLIAKIYDDNLKKEKDRYKDWFEFQSNTSNSKQNNVDNLLTIEFFKKLDGENVANNVRNPKANWMLTDEYGKWAIDIIEDTITNKNIITYEIEIQLWDEWSEIGEEYSKKHKLKSNEIIGLTVSIFDYDEGEERELLYTISGPGGKYWGVSYYMSDFILDSSKELHGTFDAIINMNISPNSFNTD
jgi:hypothetical protein